MAKATPYGARGCASRRRGRSAALPLPAVGSVPPSREAKQESLLRRPPGPTITPTPQEAACAYRAVGALPPHNLAGAEAVDAIAAATLLSLWVAFLSLLGLAVMA
jgi:hypothetical protein